MNKEKPKILRLRCRYTKHLYKRFSFIMFRNQRSSCSSRKEQVRRNGEDKRGSERPTPIQSALVETKSMTILHQKIKARKDD